MRLLHCTTAASVLISVLLASAPAAEPPSTKGLVCHWTFDGSLEDPAGAARDTLAPRGGSARYVTDVPGTSGKALALGVRDNDAQYLTAPLSDDLRLGPGYTIEAWIQPTALSNWNRLVLRWGAAPNYSYHLALHEGVLSLCHGQSNGKYIVAEGGRLEPGLWYHVAGVARPDPAQPGRGRLTVYLNGKPAGSAEYDGTIHPAANEALGVGDSATPSSAATRFRGHIDELYIWNRPLSADEIAAHYQARAAAVAQVNRDRWRQQFASRAALYDRVRKLGVNQIIFALRGPGRDLSGHYYANFGYACTDPNIWFHARDGGALCKLDLTNGEVVALVDDPAGSVRDPQVHYDGKKILFSYRKGGTHHYNLYEISADGSGLRQLTDGPWDDVEPAYLPDGGIVFSSSRCKRYIGCWLAHSATLHRCDADGRNIRMLSSGTFTENTPAILPDGRVLYTRWEYVNRDAVTFHHLWTMNPDGSGQMVYFGNMHPGGVFIDARPIPGGDRIAFIHSPGHGANEHVGYVATLTPDAGPDARSAMRNISREAQYRDPFPLSAEAMLVARGNQLLLMDSSGESEVLYAAAGNPLHEPVALVARPRPPVVAPRSDLAKATGTVVLADVYIGRNMAGVRRGDVKKLLVLEDLPKPANYHGGGSQPIGHGVTSTLKRVLGVIPVEADGSAHFQAPAMRSIYFALLDENERCIKQMRSFVTVQPGETVSCVGCHDTRYQAPSPARRTLALSRPASIIQPFADIPAVPDFPRDIQPILDRHCVRCHNPDKRDGGATLTGDRGPVFSISYYQLYLHWQVKDTKGPPMHGTGRQPGNDPPWQTYSFASPLMKKIDGSHYDVRLSEREARTVRLWLDVNAQFTGTAAAIGTGQIGGCWNNNAPIREMDKDWPSTPAARQAVERRCVSCHGKMLPRHVTDSIPVSHGDFLSWERPLTRYSRHHLFNLTRPDKSLMLLAGLSSKAGGYATLPATTPIRPVTEDLAQPPRLGAHPIVFESASDRDYVAILTHIQAAKARLDEIKRFDMPGFKPNEHYIREMKRYGVLPAAFDLAKDPIDVYATDEAYWQSFWHRPSVQGTGLTFP